MGICTRCSFHHREGAGARFACSGGAFPFFFSRQANSPKTRSVGKAQATPTGTSRGPGLSLTSALIMTPMSGSNPPKSKNREIHREGGIKLPRNRQTYPYSDVKCYCAFHRREVTRPGFIISALNYVTRHVAERTYQHKAHKVS